MQTSYANHSILQHTYSSVPASERAHTILQESAIAADLSHCKIERYAVHVAGCKIVEALAVDRDVILNNTSMESLIKAHDISELRVFLAQPTKGRLEYHFEPDYENHSTIWEQQRESTKAADQFEQLKPSNRKLAEKINIFKQPEFTDALTLLGNTGHFVYLKHIDFSELPIADMQPGSALLVHNPVSGLLVVATQSGYKLISSNRVCRQLLGGNTETHFNKSELMIFLESLQTSEYCLRQPSFKNNHLRYAQVIHEIEKLSNGVWYMKDPGGSGGEQVIQIEVANGKLVGIDARQYLENDQAKSKQIEKSNLILEQVLSLTTRFGQVYFEKAIPIARTAEYFAEPRLIFGMLDNEPTYLASYSKLGSADSLLPNRNQGGSAEPLDSSLSRIFRANGTPESKLASAVEHARVSLLKQAQAFATELIGAAKFTNQYYPYFAIDLCPAFNQQTGEIEFYLLEVQTGPGTEGLKGNGAAGEEEMFSAFLDSEPAEVEINPC